MKTILNFRFALLLCALMLCMFLSGCKKSLYTVPELSIGVISDLTFASANCNYTIISDGGRTISARGICWSTEQSPTVEDNKTTDDTWDPTFTSSMTGLSYNTTYYVRSYATNSEGTAYSEEISFKTLNPGLPNVTTSGVTDITENSATCGGNVISSGGTGVAVIARGLCWSTSPNPTITNNHSTNGSGLGTFSYNITGLTYNTTYYVRAYAVNGAGIAYGNEVFFIAGQNISSAVVTTTTVTNISQFSASSGGNVASDGGAPVTSRGVCWSTSQNPTIVNSNTINGNGIGAFTSAISGLSPNITYYVRAYATNLAGTAYGAQLSFTTITTPTISTNAISGITTTTAICGGVVINDGGATITARGVCWSSTTNPVITDSHTIDGTGTGAFISNISGLIEGSNYYVRAYATNGAGTSYGNEINFSTATLPSLTTTNISNITSTTATGGGNITNDGGATLTARGVCWSTSPNPTISNSHTSDGAGLGVFSSSITGLTGNTTYYVRAYATNSVGTSYGNQVSFPTSNIIPTITTNNITNISSSSATGGGNIASDGGSSVIARGVCWSTSQNPLVSGSHTIDGSGTGTFSSSITGLSFNITYYVRAYATNSEGTAYGNEVSFTSIAVGDSYQGGIVAYLFQPGDPGYISGETHGIIAAPSDQTAFWSPASTTTGATATALGAGAANTNTIVSSIGAGSYAARLCYDLVLGVYDDWVLPSKDELNKLFINRAAIGGFSSYYYWSSTENNSSTAWDQHLNTGTQYYNAKPSNEYVRAIRYF